MNALEIPPNELLGFERITKADRYRRWIGDTISPYIGNRVLELGCGIGNMTELFLDRELVVATDINWEYLKVVKDKFSAFANLEVGILALDRIDVNRYKTYDFDTIVGINIFEHIENDIRAIQDLKEILIPKGKLVIFVPAVKFLYSAHDRDAGHYRRYTKKELIAKVKRAGLSVKKCFYFNFIGIWGWLFSSKLLNRNMYSETQLGIFEKIVYINHYMESIIKPPIGLSLVAICQ